MSIFDRFKKTDKVPVPEEYKDTRTYDYSTPEGRIATAEWLFEQAKNERTGKEDEWRKFDDYYNGAHEASMLLKEAMEEMNIPFIPSTVPEPYIMVESQITPDVPTPEFHGRSEGDDEKAHTRQLAVQYVCDSNRINDMNTANERRLRKYGDAFWKVFWDDRKYCGEKKGDIGIKDVGLEDIYPDPTSKTLNECEYVDYVYTVHKFEFWRRYHEELKKQGLTLDDVMDAGYREREGLFDPYTMGSMALDDRIQILEHWFRQPFDDPKGEFVSGDIACTIQAGGVELKYIPRFWKSTWKQNKSFPFVHYWCIQDERSFWNKSELEPIIDMVDAADRELANAILNDSMTANDIILYEEGALADGGEISNMPGAAVKVRNGKIGAVARLGGLCSGIRSMQTVEWFQNQMQRTNRNFDTNNGRETSAVTTASGLLQIRSDAAVQQELKKADRNKGFCRLYELLDWMCLEFFDDDRLLYIGATKKDEKAEVIRFNAKIFEENYPAITDPDTGEIIREEEAYFPRLDVNVTSGDGIARNPASTVQVLDRLAAVNVTADNWKLLAAELEYLDIPQKQSIVEGWEEKFGGNVPKEVIEALEQDQGLLQAVVQMMQMTGNTGQQQGGTQQMEVGDIINEGGVEVPTF